MNPDAPVEEPLGGPISEDSSTPLSSALLYLGAFAIAGGLFIAVVVPNTVRGATRSLRLRWGERANEINHSIQAEQSLPPATEVSSREPQRKTSHED